MTWTRHSVSLCVLFLRASEYNWALRTVVIAGLYTVTMSSALRRCPIQEQIVHVHTESVLNVQTACWRRRLKIELVKDIVSYSSRTRFDYRPGKERSVLVVFFSRSLGKIPRRKLNGQRQIASACLPDWQAQVFYHCPSSCLIKYKKR